MSNALISLTETLGKNLGVTIDATSMMSSLKATCFKAADKSYKNQKGEWVSIAAPEVTDEQMMQLLLVSNQYGLNPWTKEVYAFPTKGGGIQPIVGVDGWVKIINSHPQFNGFSFEFYGDFSRPDSDAWVKCIIHRKDRTFPIEVTEYFAECAGTSEPWKKFPRRMMRHKTLIQAARLAFGFSGIIELDEYERGDYEKDVTPMQSSASASEFKLPLKDKPTPAPATKPVQASAPEPISSIVETAVVSESNERNIGIGIASVTATLKKINYTFQELCEEHNLDYVDINDLNLDELRQVSALAKKTTEKPF
jgi:phage recombination protein Bet